MSKTTKLVTKEELFTVPLPTGTDTYTVISYKFIVDTVKTKLEESNYNIISENYRATSGLNIARCTYVIEHNENPGKYFTFNWVNSYDKSTRFSCAVGGYLTENQSSIIGKEIKPFIRKHTGNADELAEATIINMINDIEEYALTIIEDKSTMLATVIEQKEIAHILGELYILHDMITIEQLSAIKRETIKPTFLFMEPAENTLWELYRNILTVIKSSHPKTWLNQQRFLHSHLISYAWSLVVTETTTEEWVAEMSYEEDLTIEEATIREEIEEEADEFYKRLEGSETEGVKYDIVINDEEPVEVELDGAAAASFLDILEDKMVKEEEDLFEPILPTAAPVMENEVSDKKVIKAIKDMLKNSLGYKGEFSVILEDDTYAITMEDDEELFLAADSI